jgi:hypothetical protein
MAKNVTGQRVITPKARLSFPSLLKPDVGGQYSDNKFKATLIFDKNDKAVMEGLKAMNAACKKVAAEAFGADIKGIDMPFRNGDEKAEKADFYKNTILITAKSKYRPGLCAADPKVEITEESDLYGGCWVRASLVPFSYAQGKNRGVSFRLCNVQKLAEGEQFGGTRVAPADDFGSAAVDADEETPFDDDTKEDNLGL